MTAPASLTPGQEQAAARVDALDLEPVVFGLMHPYPGLTVMSTAEADQVTAAYRGWLKLCAWYPDQLLVPTLTVGDAWHTHLADTAKYASDTMEFSELNRSSISPGGCSEPGRPREDAGFACRPEEHAPPPDEEPQHQAASARIPEISAGS